MPSFDKGCARCHEDQIKDQPMLLLTWPEMEALDPPDPRIVDHCHIGESFDADGFDSTSLELPGLLEAYLMDIDPDDMADYGEAYQNLGALLAMEGVQPLADLVRAKGGEPTALLGGLAPEIIAKPACNWIANQEYDGPSPLETSGWIAEPLGLSYRPLGHADPILKAWLEFSGQVSLDEAGNPLASAFKSSLLDRESGPGLCSSCHQGLDESSMVWRSQPASHQHTVFDHKPHLALEQASRTEPCVTCHKLDPAASQGYQSINVATCQQCHGQQWVDATCATCHRYHPVR